MSSQAQVHDRARAVRRAPSVTRSLRLGAGIAAIGLVSACAARHPALAAPGTETSIRPAPSGSSQTIEPSDRELTAARLALSVEPTAGNHRRVADDYLRVGVLDMAFDHYQAALRLEPADAASFDGLARIWRDWGYPDVALPNAYRATYYAPQSSVAANTLGTIQLRLGMVADAEATFQRALALEPGAPYILNNLCYAALVGSQPSEGVARCERALAAAPRQPSVRNNLALAYAAKGDLDAAAAQFAEAAPAARASYNVGIALMATHRYAEAARAFETAAALGPAISEARVRAARARVLAGQSADKESDGRR